MAENKELALGVGIAALSRDDIKKINNDKGVLLGCALDGAYWKPISNVILSLIWCKCYERWESNV